jgi:hypothetical protein
MTSVAIDTSQAARVTTASDADLPPELQKIAEDALQGLKYSFLAAALRHDAAFQDGTVEESLRRAILTRPMEKQSQYRALADKVAQQSEAQRSAEFGRFASQTLSEFAGVGFRARSAQLPKLKLNDTRLREELEALQPPAAPPIVPPLSEDTSPAVVLASSEAAHAAAPQNAVIGIGFYISEVCCKDTTSGYGSDEIKLGGLAIDEAGTTTIVNPFMVSNDFDDGEVKSYSGTGRRFYRFDTTKPTKFPKAYSVVLMFAEEDNGGFAAFLFNAWLHMAPTIKQKIEQGLAALGGYFGGALGAELGKLVGKVVGWLADKLVGWIVDAFKDDIARPITIVAPQLSAADGATYYSSPGWTNFASKPGEWWCKWDGGHYTFKGRWRVEAPGTVPAGDSPRNFIGVYGPGKDGYALWVAEWGSFVNKWKELSQAGLRLVDIETYSEGNKRMFAGTYRAGNDRYALWGGADWNNFQAKWTEYSKQGLRLISMKTYFEGNRRLYVGVFRAGSDAHAMWSGLDWNTFCAKWDEASKGGLRLLDVSSYLEGGKRYFNGVFRAGTGGYALWGSDWSSFVNKWKEFSANGLRLIDLHAYPENGKLAVIGVYRAGTDGYYLWNADWNGTIAKWQELSQSDLRLVDLAVY